MIDARAKARLQRWRDQPITMVREEFQAEPDPWQAEALAAFPDVNRLGFKACKGPGKTAVLSWLGWNFMATRPHSRVGVTSITGDNLAQNLWPEFAKWQQRSPYLTDQFTWTKTQIVSKQYPSTWWAQARSWPKAADPQQQADALAGLHEDYAMWLLDEVGGYPQAVMATAEAVLASGIETKVVMAGNPTHTTGPLYKACTSSRHLWHMVTITGDPDNPNRSPRINLEEAKKQIEQFGRDNPWVIVNVLGEFPPSSLNVLLGVEDVERAMHRHLRIDQYDWAQKRLGIDTARFGGDLTVLFPRQGLAAFRPKIMRHLRGSAVSIDIAAAVMDGKRRWGSELELFDGTGGWSAGAVDVLRAGGIEPIDVQFHGKAIDPRYKNRRAEMYFGVAKWVVDGGALPYIPELVEELTEPTYTFVNGQFQLEDKDLIRERLGRSPGYADGLALTFGLPEMPAAVLVQMRGRQTVAHDFDPFVTSGQASRDADPW